MTHVHTTRTMHGGEWFNWASLDGETWLPISRPAQDTPEEATMLAGLFEGDGNTKPMVFTRRWLAYEGAEFEEEA